jgi:hypothetical protein
MKLGGDFLRRRLNDQDRDRNRRFPAGTSIGEADPASAFLDFVVLLQGDYDLSPSVRLF